jgi:tryptophan halogenase
MNKKFVILGGGTAGWISALYIKKYFPDYEVTVVQSEKLGIIGVGEATTPQFRKMLSILNIQYIDLIKEAGATIKNGISFENWNGDGKKYFHGFYENLCPFSVPNIFSYHSYDFYVKNAINQKLDLNEHMYCSKLSYENKIDIKNISFALHFDTHLLSVYLQKIGIERGINIINGEFENVITNENDFVTNIILKDGKNIPLDFMFDCSGFSRLIIGNHYKTEWKSYKENLPMKKGIPFYLDYDGNIPPYTSSIAMKYGWCWKIPLQHRFGCGYIFDSDYIDENQALEEVEEYFGQKIEIRKVISFEAGRYEKLWVKNCIALGLSSSFIEPLESTSIFLTCMQLFSLDQFFNEFDRCDEKSLDSFNSICNSLMDDALSCVYLHYMTKRNDTDFWKNLREKYKPPEHFLEIMELLREANVRYFDIEKPNKIFSLNAYLQIANGLEFFEKPFHDTNFETTKPSIEEYKDIIDTCVSKALDHKKFLTVLPT